LRKRPSKNKGRPIRFGPAGQEEWRRKNPDRFSLRRFIGVDEIPLEVVMYENIPSQILTRMIMFMKKLQAFGMQNAAAIGNGRQRAKRMPGLENSGRILPGPEKRQENTDGR
jgi:hypothetical protein